MRWLEGEYCCAPVKTSRKGFSLDILEKLMKAWPGGSYLVLKINPRFTGNIPSMAILYKYNNRKLLGIISIEEAGSTEPVDAYLSHLPDFF